MTGRLFLLCSIFALGCEDSVSDVGPYETEVQLPHSILCGPSDSEFNGVYVSSLFTREYDASHISDLAIVETDDMDYLINLSQGESGDLEGFVDIPYASCDDVSVTFISDL
jgi:hypothetical protein